MDKVFICNEFVCVESYVLKYLVEYYIKSKQNSFCFFCIKILLNILFDDIIELCI